MTPATPVTPRSSPLRVLAVTSLFPNSVAPNLAPFNRQQLDHLASREQQDIALRVWATIPWFPRASRFAPESASARFAGVPKRDQFITRSDQVVDIEHPRTLHLPGLGRPIAGPLHLASLAHRFYQERNRTDVVLATWAYPDAWAAVLLGRVIGRPVVIKVHGSDINVVATKWPQRAQMRWGLPQAAAVVAVSSALADRVESLGVDRDRIHLVGNGVDPGRFFPADKATARAELKAANALADGRADVPIVVYVGNLKREKGVLDLMTAWPQVARSHPRARLVIIGDGPARDEVRRLANQLPSVDAIGAVPHKMVPRWIQAADLLCLPSWNEGTPNVVLEALACDRPVVASAVGGIPDLITSDVLGTLVPAREPGALAAALESRLARPSPPNQVSANASIDSWEQSAAKLAAVLHRAATR